jgi:hypothetical protein
MIDQKKFNQDRDNLINKVASTFTIELTDLVSLIDDKKVRDSTYNIAYKKLIDRLKRDNPDFEKF